MSKEICVKCKKAMGNSLNKEQGKPIHKRCYYEIPLCGECRACISDCGCCGEPRVYCGGNYRQSGDGELCVNLILEEPNNKL